MKRTFIDRIASEMVAYGIEFWIHVVATIVVCLVVAIALRFSGVDHELAGMIAGGAGVVVGFGKGIFDKKTGGEWSLMDIIGDFWGAVLFMLCHFV